MRRGGRFASALSRRSGAGPDRMAPPRFVALQGRSERWLLPRWWRPNPTWCKELLKYTISYHMLGNSQDMHAGIHDVLVSSCSISIIPFSYV